jgi:predicted transcriptional regulator
MATEPNKIDEVEEIPEQTRRRLTARFEAAYNTIDHFLRKSMQLGPEIGFKDLVRRYAERHPWWNDDGFLRTTSDLRNVIIHGKTKPSMEVGVPTRQTVEELDAVQARLTDRLVIPRFQRKVETVQRDDTLLTILQRVRNKSFSQFPVCEGQEIVGLITENGITRWLAQHATAEMPLCDFAEVSVAQVLSSEEPRRNIEVVARQETVNGVRALFAKNSVLEVVLITEHGKRSETPLGIITRWDWNEL